MIKKLFLIPLNFIRKIIVLALLKLFLLPLYILNKYAGFYKNKIINNNLFLNNIDNVLILKIIAWDLFFNKNYNLSEKVGMKVLNIINKKHNLFILYIEMNSLLGTISFINNNKNQGMLYFEQFKKRPFILNHTPKTYCILEIMLKMKQEEDVLNYLLKSIEHYYKSFDRNQKILFKSKLNNIKELVKILKEKNNNYKEKFSELLDNEVARTCTNKVARK